MGRRPQDDRSGGHTKNPEVPGGNSEAWTCLQVTTGCHEARASWGVRPRILPNPSCKKLCSAHQLLPRLTDCCRPLCRPLFLEPQFPHLGQIALTQPQDEVGQERHPAQGLQASTSASLLSLPGPMVHPSVTCLPGCGSKRLSTSGREGAGLSAGSSAPAHSQ